jgi:type I protein arginine methyltransferase
VLHQSSSSSSSSNCRNSLHISNKSRRTTTASTPQKYISSSSDTSILLNEKKKKIMSSDSETTPFMNASAEGEIPSFNGDAQAKATDFANYFCSYAQLYHQKQMLADHNRMAAYHSAILGNQDVFRDKVVMDIGTGSGILAVWAAQAGARRVYAIEYTDMAQHARQVMKANGVDHIVTVIQGAVEDVVLPVEADNLEVVPSDVDGSQLCVDIIVSEWMGYFLLRESMLDSIIRARDKFLKPATGLMFPSHTTMYLAPISDEEERKLACNEYASAMSDWQDFQHTTNTVYGVDMSVLEHEFDREQKEYYLLSSRWTELHSDAILSDPQIIKEYDMMTCTLEDARGVLESDRNNNNNSSNSNSSNGDRQASASFDFDINGDECASPVSGFSGWFTADFKSRTDAGTTADTPRLQHPAFLSTGPENGYTHWGE